MRFDAVVSFAPVPAAGDVFVVNGNSLSTSLRDTAAAVTAGDQAAIGAALDTLAGAIGHVADRNATLGLSAGRLERIGDGLASRDITLADERSSVEDTDLSVAIARSEEHTSELQSLMRIPYAVFFLKKNKHNNINYEVHQ